MFAYASLGRGGREGGIPVCGHKPVGLVLLNVQALQHCTGISVLTGLLFNSGIWDLVCCYGNEILQLQKTSAWDSCWCQVVTSFVLACIFE